MSEDKGEEQKQIGNEFYRKGLMQEAISSYTKAIELSNNPLFYLNRSQAHLGAKNYSDAFLDSFCFLRDRKDVELSFTSKAFYRMAMAIKEQLKMNGNSVEVSRGNFGLLLSGSLIANDSIPARKALYNFYKSIFDIADSNLKKGGSFSLYNTFVSRPYIWNNRKSLFHSIDVLEDNFDNSYISENIESSISKCKKILMSSCGNSVRDFLKVLNNLSSRSSVYIVDTSLNRLARLFVLKTILEKGYSITFFLSIFYDSFLSVEDSKTLSNLFDEIYKELNDEFNKKSGDKEKLSFSNFVFHDELASSIACLLKIWKTLFIDKSLLDCNSPQWINKEDVSIGNPLLFDPVTRQSLIKNRNIENQMKEFNELESLWSIFDQLKENNGTIHVYCQDTLKFLLEQYTGSSFDLMLTNNLIINTGLWNFLPICISRISSTGIIRTHTKYGNPKRYEELIYPMNCNEDDIPFLLSSLGLKAETKYTEGCLIVDWSKSKNSSKSDEETVRYTVQTLTKILMRFSVSAIQPYPDDNSEGLLKSGYQYPCNTPYSYLLCAKQAESINENSTKHLVDLVLVSEELSRRPFIHHRKLGLRIIASSLITQISQSFLSHELIIPLTEIQWKKISVEPIDVSSKKDVQHSKISLGLLLLPSKSSAEESIKIANSSDKSNLFLWMMSKDEKELQILDSLFYDPFSQFLTFLYSQNDFMSSMFTYGVLVDWNVYRVITKPFTL